MSLLRSPNAQDFIDRTSKGAETLRGMVRSTGPDPIDERRLTEKATALDDVNARARLINTSTHPDKWGALASDMGHALHTDTTLDGNPTTGGYAQGLRLALDYLRAYDNTADALT